MQIKEGASVKTVQGEEAGRVDRVVIDPRSRVVTHLVVRKGLFFPEDKVLPIEFVESASEEQVVLKEDSEALKDLPPFEETYYVDAEPAEQARSGGPRAVYAPSVLYYPTFRSTMVNSPDYRSGSETVAETRRNIPEQAVALKENARVISVDGEEIGTIERILMNPETDKATHFVVSRGMLTKTKKLIPSLWLDWADEDAVHLLVQKRLLDNLPEFDE